LRWLRWPDWLAHAGTRDAEPKSYLQCNHYCELVQLAVNGQRVAPGRLALVLPMLPDGRLIAMHSVSPKDIDYACLLIAASSNGRPEVAVFHEWIIAEVKQTAGKMASLVFSDRAGRSGNQIQTKKRLHWQAAGVLHRYGLPADKTQAAFCTREFKADEGRLRAARWCASPGRETGR
jgi:hypothetical protein